MISIEEAYRRLEQTISPHQVHHVSLTDAPGRLLVEPVKSDVNSPPHRKSVMDGFAIRSADLNAGQQRLKVVGTVLAGSWPEFSIGPHQAARIMTGAPVPDGADAVVMSELTTDCARRDEQYVEIQLDSIPVGKHIMEPASNFAAGQTLFSPGHRFRAYDVGLLAEAGLTQIRCGGWPDVAILPTGDELISCDQVPEKGQIRNSNSPLLQASLKSLKLSVTDLGIGRDQTADLKTMIRRGLQHDLLILTGGVSAGDADLVPEALKSVGVEEVFHKVSIKPGKPIWFGVAQQNRKRCYVLGLPGNPVSSLVGFHLFIRSALRLLEGAKQFRPQVLPATLSTDHETRGGRPTYWPGRLVQHPSPQRQIEPLDWHGSSDLLRLGQADGLICFDAETNTHSAGKTVGFIPFADCRSC